MGKLPKADRILKQGILWKLSSTHEWKPMQVALTTAGLFMARPNEEQLRDLIPLYEIRDVKKKIEIPSDAATFRHTDSRSSNLITEHSYRTSSSNLGTVRNVKLTALVDSTPQPEGSEHFIIQVRTIEGGYNSGRTYYFDARSEDLCNEWLQMLRKEADQAVVLKQAGPSQIQKFRFRLRRIYRSVPVQGTVAILIVLCFVVNIIQTEMASDTDRVFLVLEYFFTVTFLIELLTNMAAHLFHPFFQVVSSHAFASPILAPPELNT